VMARGSNGPYTLADHDGKTLDKQWNLSFEALLCVTHIHVQ